MKSWEEHYKKKGINAQRKYPNTDLISFVVSNFKKGDKILELGCGSGANMWFLAEQELEVYGIDTSQTSLDICKEVLAKKGLNANLSNQSMLDFKFDFKFDGIVDVVSIQHCDNIKSCYKGVYNSLKPDGKFFSYHLNKGKEYYGFDQLECLAKERAYDLLKQVGFKNIEIEELHRLSDRIIKYLIIKAFR